ncbi:hypothetical protein [Paraburkholderia sediminicola]|uniref:hypothetical protein n=1 Tax=Paraburkholderia sediminicola TaxID=458836 RepID=UPI0038BD049F
MAHSHKIPRESQAHVADQIAKIWHDDHAERNATRNMGHDQKGHSKVFLAESFEVWSLSEADIQRRWGRLSDVATPTGHLHHQIRSGPHRSARHYARSQKEGNSEKLSVRALMQSPIAEQLDAAIKWVDAHEHEMSEGWREDPIVRLLIIPSRLMHVLWFTDGSNERFFAVDPPHNDPEFETRQFLTSKELQEALQRNHARRDSIAPQRADVADNHENASVVTTSRRRFRNKGRSSASKDERMLRHIRAFMFAFVCCNILWIMLLAISSLSLADGLRVLAVSGLFSAASLITGGLVGFIFGIPRSLANTSAAIVQGSQLNSWHQANSDSPRARPLNVRPNTNLEHISDWLTQVLVGISLTQLGKIAALTGLVGARLAPALAPLKNAGVIAVAICAAFAAAGFGWAYLECRTSLMRVFSDDNGAGSDEEDSVSESVDYSSSTQAVGESSVQSTSGGSSSFPITPPIKPRTS